MNIDLAVFDGKPKQLARFLATFHEYRSVIAFMFQDLNRAKSTEPVEISPEFAKKLANWTGSEVQLKKALYNEGYFNPRVGRKTRYTHLDMSAYFQDIIPEEFISDDFDISSPDVKWRPAFRVDPKIRKAEVRLMNAPRDAYESALQIKLWRAILHKALNRSGAIEGKMQTVSHEEYLNDPDKLFRDLKAMTDDLGLELDEFRPLAGEGLANVETYTQSKFYRPLAERLTINPKFNHWGSAVARRGRSSAISSTGRAYQGPSFPEQDEFQRLRKLAARQNMNHRAGGDFNYLGVPRLNRSHSCPEIILDLLN